MRIVISGNIRDNSDRLIIDLHRRSRGFGPKKLDLALFGYSNNYGSTPSHVLCRDDFQNESFYIILRQGAAHYLVT